MKAKNDLTFQSFVMIIGHDYCQHLLLRVMKIHLRLWSPWQSPKNMTLKVVIVEGIHYLCNYRVEMRRWYIVPRLCSTFSEKLSTTQILKYRYFRRKQNQKITILAKLLHLKFQFHITSPFPIASNWVSSVWVHVTFLDVKYNSKIPCWGIRMTVV